MLVLFVLAGCASPQVTVYNSGYAPRAENAEIEIFQTQKPDRPYIELGQISIGDTNNEYNMKQILKKAREMGADAIIILGSAGQAGVVVPIGNIMAYGGSESYGISAFAIKYK